MLAELTIVPLRGGLHISDEIAEVVKVIDASGLPYELTPSGTCIEGDWDAVMALIRRCHDHIRNRSPHVMTLIKVEDEEGQDQKLLRNVESVEKKVGHPLKRDRALITADTAPSHP